MLIVVPVSKHDAQLSEDFCAVINFFAPYRGHSLLVIGNPSARLHIENIYFKIEDKFDRSAMHLFEADAPEGWPAGPNFYFKKTIEYLRAVGNKSHWFWMELDVTPVADNWLDCLERGYLDSDSKCMGFIQEATETIKKRHLAGTAIYPKDLNAICSKCTDDLVFAFDYECSDQVLPHSMHSRLFQHNFRTCNYYCSSEGLVGVEEGGRRQGVNFNKVVSKSAVVVHGCNDGSLARLIIGKV